MSEAQVTLPAAVSSVPTARHFVESILTGWGLADLGWHAAMIVSELASNAALHARGQQISIRVGTEGEGVRIEVSDGSLRLPQQRSYSAEATTGRGLRLVQELSAEWGVVPAAAGKSIWALLLPASDLDVDDDDDVEALLSAFEDKVIPITEARERACCRCAA